ncbi:MAG: kinase, pfkB family protein [Solirubrobacterales bacterium]|jgi:2-dehydro-3-deoxygluconokinase|nr:kinase, pfkB family protein [Solirubrobacterales bacterium]
MPEALEVRDRDACRWDIVSLGEVMLRFDPGEGRVATARTFRVWEGGGEYNVARGLRKVFGQRSAIVTAFADNAVGRLLEDLVLQGGVDMSHVSWVPYDGMGRSVRNGLNFTERGFGVRGALGCSDRGHTAVSQLERGQIDWERIFVTEGARWFHCGGIFAGLSPTTADVAEEAMEAARAAGVIVSYDLNYRPSLWDGAGGHARAREVNRRLAALVDVMFGNEEDFHASLGYEIEGSDGGYASLDTSSYASMLAAVVDDYPNLKVIATSLREVQTATVNDWGGICYSDGQTHVARSRESLEILDRVGGGDSFAAGIIYGLLEGLDVPDALELGVAHGALAMTTPGDTSMATLKEVQRVAEGASARVQR